MGNFVDWAFSHQGADGPLLSAGPHKKRRKEGTRKKERERGQEGKGGAQVTAAGDVTADWLTIQIGFVDVKDRILRRKRFGPVDIYVRTGRRNNQTRRRNGSDPKTQKTNGERLASDWRVIGE